MKLICNLGRKQTASCIRQQTLSGEAQRRNKRSKGADPPLCILPSQPSSLALLTEMVVNVSDSLVASQRCSRPMWTPSSKNSGSGFQLDSRGWCWRASGHKALYNISWFFQNEVKNGIGFWGPVEDIYSVTSIPLIYWGCIGSVLLQMP